MTQGYQVSKVTHEAQQGDNICFPAAMTPNQHLIQVRYNTLLSDDGGCLYYQVWLQHQTN